MARTGLGTSPLRVADGLPMEVTSNRAATCYILKGTSSRVAFSTWRVLPAGSRPFPSHAGFSVAAHLGGCRAFMAEPTSVTTEAAPIPSSADIKRAEKFVRERFLHDGEDPVVALAAGTPRRRALDQALVELGEKAKIPSTAWRREFSLLLGLERVLSDEEPRLADGTVLSAHQVDALSGTLTALLAEALRTSAGNGNARSAASPELLASAAIFGPDDPTPSPEDLSADAPPADDPAKGGSRGRGGRRKAGR